MIPTVSLYLADLYLEGLMVTVVSLNNTLCSQLMYFLLALGSNLNSHSHLCWQGDNQIACLQ